MLLTSDITRCQHSTDVYSQINVKENWKSRSL